MTENENAFKLTVRNLNLHYGPKHALQDVSIDMRANRVTALIGPSGCGKSTFLRTLNRMNDLIDSVRITGEIKVDGEDIYANVMDTVDLRKRVGMIFQKSNPFPKSIYENVAYGPRIHGLSDKAKMDALVEKSLRRSALWDEVKDELHKSAFSLSGGQQQRLCIARALAVGPEVLLMDEPASALDPIATAKIEELIYELKERYTIVIVTHNMQQAARVSDDTAFFYMGRLVETDATEKIFTSPKNKQTEITLREGSDNMERHFEKDLTELSLKLEQMVALCEDGLGAVSRGFREGDSVLAEPAFQNERRVNQLEIEIDHAVADCFALFQPVAVDLRFLLAILKINNDLERIGDHVVNIAQSVVTCASRTTIPTRLELPRTFDLSATMFSDACRSFFTKDLETARAVLEADDMVDGLNRSNTREAIQMVKNGTLELELALELLRISRNLERIADLSTNIAEEVIFHVQAKVVKHHVEE